MRWLLERMRLYSEALSGIDDLTGEELLQLQARVQLLESEIARLKALVEALRPAAETWVGAVGMRLGILREGLLMAHLRPKLEGSNPHRTGRSENARNLGS
jgi:uncharacterized small protein (DUF1192 family)